LNRLFGFVIRSVFDIQVFNHSIDYYHNIIGNLARIVKGKKSPTPRVFKLRRKPTMWMGHAGRAAVPILPTLTEMPLATWAGKRSVRRKGHTELPETDPIGGSPSLLWGGTKLATIWL
jgi:hypothetical protein